MLKVKVEGYAHAKFIMDQLRNDMQKKMLKSSLRGCAKPMLKSAKSKVPVKSGELKEKLKIISYRDKNAPKSEVAIAVKPVFEKTKKKGSINQFYGKFIHDGTAPIRKSGKGKFLVFENKKGEKVFTKSVKGITPTPYLTAAYNETNDTAIQMFGDELAKAVKKFINRNFKPLL